ncbi:peroxiredoxin-like family protein [Blastomonas sp. SL216]|uniref:peroxiredoxin-like family protein n=1 Tax=Blastomonas sp. SL216 TaxID=2995169 RepID=UPI002376D8BD|nr:peroxiredoxin-like family protein [Blastomonas sp. SL216]
MLVHTVSCGKCRLRIGSMHGVMHTAMRAVYRLDTPMPLSPCVRRVHKPSMEQTTRLYEKLQSCTLENSEWNALYDAFVGRLILLETGHSAPGLGMDFPDLVLPDHLGRYQKLTAVQADGPVVITFIRGGWCPWCRSELDSWNENLAALEAVGGRLVVIVGEVAGRADRIESMLDGKAMVLCDIDHGAALDLGLAFHAGVELVQRYLQAGLDLADIYGTDSGILPVPATFVVDPQGVVRYAFVDPDFRVRAEPLDVISVVQELGSGGGSN